MRRRLTAWIALLAMGLALPAHAYAHLAGMNGMGSDFCTTDPAARTTPALPASDQSTACAACCASAGGACAVSGATAHALPPSASAVVRGHAPDASRAEALRIAFARGPPAAA